MDGLGAMDLVSDKNIALAIPMASQFKTEPILTQQIQNMTTGVIPGPVGGTMQSMMGTEGKNVNANDMMSFHVTLADGDDIEEVSTKSDTIVPRLHM